MKKHDFSLMFLAALSLAGCNVGGKTIAETSQSADIDRTILPIAEPKPPVYTQLDVRNATPPPRFQVKAPKGAPNVLLVLVDDLGFAGTGKFGGPVDTPNFEKNRQ